MNDRVSSHPQPWDLAVLENEAVDADALRHECRNLLLHRGSQGLKNDIEQMTALMIVLGKLDGNIGFYPRVQQDVHSKIRSLLREILEQALPKRRPNIKLPDPDIIRALINEAKAVVGVLSSARWAESIIATARQGERGAVPDQLDYRNHPEQQKYRQRLVSAWVRSRVGKNTTDRALEKIHDKVLNHLTQWERAKTQGRKPSEYRASLQLVAALLRSTPASVKKTAARGTIVKRHKRDRKKPTIAAPTAAPRRRRG